MSASNLGGTIGANSSAYGTPSISRTTSVPTSESYTACGWVKVPSYVDWAHVFASESATATRSMFVEAEAAGDVYNFENSGGGTSDFWIDASTAWNFIASVGRTANIIGYVLKGGVWTTIATITSPAGAHDRMSFGSEWQFAEDCVGTFLCHSLRVWNIEKTLSELQAEARSVKPRHWTGLTFWSSGLVAASLNVDLSGTGGSFTLNGSPGSSSDDPGVPWQRSRTYGYA